MIDSFHLLRVEEIWSLQWTWSHNDTDMQWTKKAPAYESRYFETWYMLKCENLENMTLKI